MNEKHALFGQLAINFDFSIHEEIQECLNIQQKNRKKGNSQFLGQIMCSKGFLTQRQVEVILKQQNLKQYACPKCNNIFNQKQHLQKIICPDCNASLKKANQFQHNDAFDYDEQDIDDVEEIDEVIDDVEEIDEVIDDVEEIDEVIDDEYDVDEVEEIDEVVEDEQDVDEFQVNHEVQLEHIPEAIPINLEEIEPRYINEDYNEVTEENYIDEIPMALPISLSLEEKETIENETYSDSGDLASSERNILIAEHKEKVDQLEPPETLKEDEVSVDEMDIDENELITLEIGRAHV